MGHRAELPQRMLWRLFAESKSSLWRMCVLPEMKKGFPFPQRKFGILLSVNETGLVSVQAATSVWSEVFRACVILSSLSATQGTCLRGRYLISEIRNTGRLYRQSLFLTKSKCD
ncbi:hypothetical protein TNIN_212231 [Trichonephila inaurata madagascariensis]|uniref:Uncharacterized protein n=1 Tax=Trichonephila inaurata madagascariensis TaxID=2747483 RepID=A0A8X7C1X7_9ARAC|nr:hypothetical protein TNIN_212231 [Trichonephila inaurata madagascariensis]